MHNPLWNALVVEMEDFLTKNEVFEQRRTPFARAERVLIIADAMPKIVCQMAEAIMMIAFMRNVLMQFASGPCLFVNRRLATPRSMSRQAIVIGWRLFVVR